MFLGVWFADLLDLVVVCVFEALNLSICLVKLRGFNSLPFCSWIWILADALFRGSISLICFFPPVNSVDNNAIHWTSSRFPRSICWIMYGLKAELLNSANVIPLFVHLLYSSILDRHGFWIGVVNAWRAFSRNVIKAKNLVISYLDFR